MNQKGEMKGEQGCCTHYSSTVVVTLFIQCGPFSYEAGIQRGPVHNYNVQLLCTITVIFVIAGCFPAIKITVNADKKNCVSI